MTKVIVKHHVADFDRWHAVFIEHGDVRRSHGATGHTVLREASDPNSVLIVNDFTSAEGAAAFMADPSLHDAMERGGVDDAPQVWVTDDGESAAY